MKTARTILETHNNGVWIEANAGSGKTHNLMIRLLYLLLQEANPSQIICLSFTNTAQYEMNTRLMSVLTYFASGNEQQFDKYEIPQHLRDPKRWEGVLKQVKQSNFSVHTIHSLCSYLIQSFVYNNQYKPLNLLTNKDWFLDNLETHLLPLLERHNKAYVYTNLLNAYGRHDVNNLDNNLVESMHRLNAETYITESTFTLDSESFLPSVSDLMNWTSVIQANYEAKVGKKQYVYTKKLIEALNMYVNNPTVKNWEGVMSACFSDKWIRRSRLSKQAEELDIQEPIEAIIKLVLGYQSAVIEQEAATDKLVEDYAYGMKQAYRQFKNEQDRLDFNDLLVYGKGILNQPETFAILTGLKLDFRHILVDEAQDLSVLQWTIVESLINNALSYTESSFLIVGDAKQSIFSFQGADVSFYNQMKHQLENQCKAIEKLFEVIALETSYRTTPLVLSVIDDYCNKGGIFEVAVKHTTAPLLMPKAEYGSFTLALLASQSHKKKKSTSQVELEAEGEAETGVDEEEELTSQASYIVKLIHDKLGVYYAPLNRVIQPNDILVLLESTTQRLERELSEGLKALAIPYSLNMNNQFNWLDSLIVKDFVALLGFVVHKYDNMACAGLIAGPLFGIKFKEWTGWLLTANEEGISLYDYIVNHELISPKDWERLKPLSYLSANDPLGYWEYFYYHPKVVASYLAMTEYANNFFKVRERLCQFIQELVAIQTTTTLGDLIVKLTSSNLTVKEELVMQDNAVHITTRHSSKGLEAPIVIVVDCKAVTVNDLLISDTVVSKYAKTIGYEKMQNLITLMQSYNLLGPRTAVLNEALNTTKSLLVQEKARTLYVAMTRAQYELIVVVDSKKESTQWVQFEKNHLALLTGVITQTKDHLTEYSLGKVIQQEASGVWIEEAEDKVEPKVNLETIIQPHALPFMTLTPLSEPTEDRLFGESFHRLVSQLQDLAPAELTQHLLSWLNKEWSHYEHTPTLRRTLPKVVEWVGRLDGEVFTEMPIAYNNEWLRLDRLVVREREVVVIDYKLAYTMTTLTAYVEQISLYKTALEQYYAKPIVAYIVFLVDMQYIEVTSHQQYSTLKDLV